MYFQINDLVEDHGGDKAVVVEVYPDGTLDVRWDCTGWASNGVPPHHFTNLSERVRELDEGGS